MFVTGKGGTGKSTVAAALARAASRAGLRTLACEMDAKGSLAACLGVPTPGFTPAKVDDRLWAMTMDTESSLREYLRVHLRLPLVAKIGPLASTFDFVADAAPGVKEVLAVGKVCWEVRENHFDIVVVDGEASGHIVSQIASPRVINRLVSRGPLGDQTRWMLDILDDASRCAVVLVANPEDMVVNETLDLLARLRNETRTDVAAVVLNRCPRAPLSAATVPVFERLAAWTRDHRESAPVALANSVGAVGIALRRQRESDAQRRRLIEAVSPVPVLEVPAFGRVGDERAGDSSGPGRTDIVEMVVPLLGGNPS